MNEWINIKDEIPKDGQVFLAYTGIGNPIIVKMKIEPSGITWEWCATGFMLKDNSVTHWMPLPKPPKEITDG